MTRTTLQYHISKNQIKCGMRVTRDLENIDIPAQTVTLHTDNKNHPMEFSMTIKPDKGFWKNGIFKFNFSIPSTYPIDQPTVTCVTKLYHPNIDYQGGVCVNALRPWKPMYTIEYIMFGLLFIFSDPNPDDPLNIPVGELLRSNPTQFARNVTASLNGRRVDGQNFTRNPGGPFR